jgi:hypothetical protein
LRSALAIAGLRVVIAKAQELIAEFEDEANPGGGSLSAKGVFVIIPHAAR